MSQAHRKIRRIQPVIRVRQARVEQESALLTAIRNEKIAAVSEMKESQRQYMSGIERLNKERVSLNRELLTPLESSLDFTKAKWYSLYRRVQDIERREQAQISQLITAERELKAVEKLEENYQGQFKSEQRKQDQNTMDESAIRRHAQR